MLSSAPDGLEEQEQRPDHGQHREEPGQQDEREDRARPADRAAGPARSRRMDATMIVTTVVASATMMLFTSGVRKCCWVNTFANA